MEEIVPLSACKGQSQNSERPQPKCKTLTPDTALTWQKGGSRCSTTAQAQQQSTARRLPDSAVDPLVNTVLLPILLWQAMKPI